MSRPKRAMNSGHSRMVLISSIVLAATLDIAAYACAPQENKKFPEITDFDVKRSAAWGRTVQVYAE